MEETKQSSWLKLQSTDMPFKRVGFLLYSVSFVLLIALRTMDTIGVAALARQAVQDILGLILCILITGFGINTVIKVRTSVRKKSITVIIAIIVMCLGLFAGYVVMNKSIKTTILDIVEGPYSTTAYVQSVNKRRLKANTLEINFEDGKLDEEIQAQVQTSESHVIDSLKSMEKRWVKINVYRHSGILVDWKQLDVDME
ncbi:hypothetical protein EJ419_06880 [Alloscardovia theropitheci]|uniref:Uncharacterized protein n=1 Tax=Alloscardovia theropitheci TaxID=2496842 RepID=A0A4R0QWM8_9BIFI|nr:hypothetical protein [Alloscardovia theropitheci]TCD53691.1 hypothetical protein EJ419_06880 [Alloscardovia theropitheci]